MAKFSLTLSPGYVPHWGLWEGVRECVQNALDAARDDHPYTIQHSGSTLTITTHGVKLDRKIWLLGFTTKADGGYIGRFGEGSAIGILALTRAGHKVRIINDDESWTPSIEASDAFASPVLTIRTRALPQPTGDFTVEIKGVSARQWREYREYFLELSPPERAIGYSDRLLISPAHAGRLYVKGVYVQDLENYSYGYDLGTAETDRDRKMISAWDLKYKISQIWLDLCSNPEACGGELERQQLVNAAYSGLNQGADEFHPMSDYAYERHTAPFAEKFIALHGEDAVPVAFDSDAKRAEHHGLKPVYVGGKLCRLLYQNPALKLDNAIKAKASSVIKTHERSDLSHREEINLQAAFSLLAPHCRALGYPELEAVTSVASFAGNDTLGQYRPRPDGGFDVLIDRRCLLDLARTLQVLVHEICHCRGGDGDVHHERAEGELFSKALAALHLGHHQLTLAT